MPEGYLLSLRGDTLQLCGTDAAGLFYGLQTLCQYFQLPAHPSLEITDWPDLAVRSDYAEQYPKAVQALIRAWFRAVEYAKENPDDANPIMAKSQGMSTEDFEEQLQNVRYYDEAYAEEYLCGGKMTEMAQKASDLWTEVNLMEEPVDAKTLVDASYLTAVLEESASSTSEA